MLERLAAQQMRRPRAWCSRCVILVLALCVGPVLSRTAYSECDRHAGGQCGPPHPGGLNGTLTVAIAQTVSNHTSTLESNALWHAEWVARAATEGARVVLFPELSMTGYYAEAIAELAGQTGEAVVANQRVRAAEALVAAACARHSIYAILGVPVFHGNITAAAPRPWYNTALVIDPDGRRVYRQAKLYPCCVQVALARANPPPALLPSRYASPLCFAAMLRRCASPPRLTPHPSHHRRSWHDVVPVCLRDGGG